MFKYLWCIYMDSMFNWCMINKMTVTFIPCLKDWWLVWSIEKYNWIDACFNGTQTFECISCPNFRGLAGICNISVPYIVLNLMLVHLFAVWEKKCRDFSFPLDFKFHFLPFGTCDMYNIPLIDCQIINFSLMLHAQ